MSLMLFGAKLLAAYLLGSLSGSLILGRMRGVDIRTQGSGNAGGTNAYRTQGILFALGTVVIDVGKGALAAALTWVPPAIAEMDPLVQGLSLGLACTAGHIWPLFFGFRGGKGGAVVIGMLAVCFPLSILPMVGVWLVCLSLSGYVGLSTVLAGATLIPTAWFFADPAQRPALLILGVVTTALFSWTHRGNLDRLRRGTEHRFERARVLARLLRLVPSRDA